MRTLRLTGAFLGAFGLVTAGLTVPARATTTTSHTFQFNGNLCFPSVFGPSLALEHSQFGVHNPSATAEVLVDCPATVDSATNATGGSTTITGVQIGTFDRNSTLDITCTLLRTATDTGLVTSIATVKSINGAPTGPDAAYQTKFTSFSTGAGFNALLLECSIPRSQSGSVSHLFTYSIFTSQTL